MSSATVNIKKSRIGKKPVAIPSGVKVSLTGSVFKTEGPKGSLSLTINPSVKVIIDTEKKEIQVDIKSDDRKARALHGLYRSLVNNNVIGVDKGYERKLEVHGIGYTAEQRGNKIVMAVGYSHTIDRLIPDGISVDIKRVSNELHHVTLQGCDKQAIGEFAAKIRAARPPEPYKGKGVRYSGEVVRRKQGKAFGK